LFLEVYSGGKVGRERKRGRVVGRVIRGVCEELGVCGRERGGWEAENQNNAEK
jgi:hypothetical protein